MHCVAPPGGGPPGGLRARAGAAPCTALISYYKAPFFFVVSRSNY
jgi:hypothetical protein